MSKEINGMVKAPEGWNTEDTSAWGGVADLSEIYRRNQQFLQEGSVVKATHEQRTYANVTQEQSVQTV